MALEGRGRLRDRLLVRTAQGLRRASRVAGFDQRLRRAGLTRIVEERLLRSIFDDPSVIVRVSASGFDLDVPGTSTQGYLHERYEPTTLRWIQGEMEGGEHCVDVGAHIGLTTLVMARAASPRGSVTACEPSPATFVLLSANIERSSLSNVRLVNVACGAKSGTAVLSVQRKSERNFVVAGGPPKSTDQVVEVQTLDELLPPGVDAFDVVKIDVEGFELQVLAGAKRAIDPDRTSLVVEWNPAAQEMAGVDPVALPQAILQLGYTIEVIDDDAGEVRPFDDVLSYFLSSGYPDEWYVNLVCRRTTAELTGQRTG